MKLRASRLVDECLGAEERCLGAVFCSYTFDPAYFEEHVLRSLLHLRSDPEEDSARYHEEARRVLQEVPVACFIDAAVRKPGRRLPYDVHLVRRSTFHPKVMLVMYEREARLAVGSGNLTKSGLEQNTELFFTRRLRYDEPSDAAMLHDVGQFLDEVANHAGVPGTQLLQVRDTLDARLRAMAVLPGDSPRDAQFVSSFGKSLLEQLQDVIHPEAKLSRVGVLAPFFEQDDFDASERDALDAVLDGLFKLRPSTGAVLDVAVPWEDATIAAPPLAELLALDDDLGALWARRRQGSADENRLERMEHFVVTATAPKRIDVINGAGEPGRLDRETLEREIKEGRLWRVPKPVIHAPKNILQRLTSDHRVGLWLHPTIDTSPAGLPQRRPLHAKAILVTAVHRGRPCTYALLGSANASRLALARSVAKRGNVEAGILCRLDGEITLRELLPSLVSYSLDRVELKEREPPVRAVDLSACIEEVVHDAAARTLTVSWDANDVRAGNWTLRYLDRDIATGEGVPSEPTQIDDFELQPASAEVTFISGEGEWQVPIRVRDLAALPTSSMLASPSLRELLAILGRRIGAEQLGTLKAERSPRVMAGVLENMFGEKFGPTDVFRAWWGAVEDLQTAPTVAAFRHRLQGPTGLRRAWQELFAVPAEALSRDEVWIYGCELLRELRPLSPLDGADAARKGELLAEFENALRADLARAAPRSAQHPWLQAVSAFYGVEEGHVGA